MATEVILCFDEDGSVYARLSDWVMLRDGVPESRLIEAVKRMVLMGFPEPCIAGWEELVIRSRGRTLVWFVPPENLRERLGSQNGG